MSDCDCPWVEDEDSDFYVWVQEHTEECKKETA